MKQYISTLFSLVPNKKPLVHHITNEVTINDCANATLAIGASPVMASSIHEAAEMVQLANALVLNFGTIRDETFQAMLLAGEAANALSIPIILDPVGVGATTFRTNKVFELLKKVQVQVIRGNASEVYRLLGGETITRGVDSGEVSISQAQLAKEAAQKLQCTVIVSGAQDAVSDGVRTATIDNGDILLTKVTGTGCMTTSLIGSFAGVTNDYFAAGIAGMSTMSIAGEIAAKLLQPNEGTSTYRTRIIDQISLINEDIWNREVKLHAEQISI